jgi:hypothetical protein
LWVDEIVMACCNHAFDLAVAHRAPEVRVEHLISAMTLTDAAVGMLEARGLRVANLRREVANVIAAEPPAAYPNGRVRPRKGEDLEDVLRLAADRAYPRRTPVTVDDLLDVMMGGDRSIPAVALLHRFAAPREEPAWNEPRYEAPPQPAPSRPHVSEPRYFDVYEPPRRPIAPPQSLNVAPDPRIDAMDRALRDITQDMNSDRKALAAAVTSIETHLAEARTVQAKMRTELLDRLNMLEARADGGEPLAARIGQLERSATVGLDRLARLERHEEDRHATLAALPADLEARTGAAVAAAGEDLVARITNLERLVENRAAETGRMVAYVSDRLRGFEDAVAGVRNQVGQMRLTFGTRLEEIAQANDEAHRNTTEQLQTHVEERFSSLQTSVAEGTRTAAEIGAGHVQDLMEIHDVLDKLGSALNEWRLDMTGDLSIVSNRLASLEASALGPNSTLESIKDSLAALRGERIGWWRRFRIWLFGAERLDDMGWQRPRMPVKWQQTLRQRRDARAATQAANGNDKESSSH